MWDDGRGVRHMQDMGIGRIFWKIKDSSSKGGSWWTKKESPNINDICLGEVFHQIVMKISFWNAWILEITFQKNVGFHYKHKTKCMYLSWPWLLKAMIDLGPWTRG
jgi:hypothetical protein